ncbi:hypothetical protein [Acetobacter senegalensis]|uniref:hypothetical protein n=1 Tax=Acetobacter senegalensis TaxID=446692 RepID=UPI0026555B80|nr:hypothetical protein [Acetobacter senegalensis]MDN7351799.1 hypothetical protein [Acetobacter senegalensis]
MSDSGEDGYRFNKIDQDMLESMLAAQNMMLLDLTVIIGASDIPAKTMADREKLIQAKNHLFEMANMLRVLTNSMFGMDKNDQP